jgi:secreted trypsin-like serine protease
MRKAVLLTGVALLVSLVLTAAVQAITFGENDNGRHPFVGSLVAEIDGDNFQLCTGTLVSPTVVVTAAHCLIGLEEFGVTAVRVTFDDVIDADADGVVDDRVRLLSGTGHVHPEAFSDGASDTHDLAVFVLDRAIRSGPYGELPTAGLLDTIDKSSTLFTTVGYGTVRDDKTGGSASFETGTRRKVATQELLSLSGPWATFSMNPSTGSGGTCFGDSGGPHFLGAGATETRIVVSITVTGDRWCRATDKTYRLDTESSRDFLDDFVPVP